MAPADATARCSDGTYSTSSGQGTCSRHGGVAEWLMPCSPHGGVAQWLKPNQ
ncbi:MAG: DUF3761 domain-containing protein [Gemmatimonadales bacterium]